LKIEEVSGNFFSGASLARFVASEQELLEKACAGDQIKMSP
jgi:hypothetical protein